MRGALTCLFAAAAAASAAGQNPAIRADLEARLARVSARVEQFYARSRTVTSKETVRIQPLETDFRSFTPARELVYERRVAWEPSADGAPPEASVLRQLLTVNGRPPRPKDKPKCSDPKDVSADALAMLLPQNLADYEFKAVGDTRVDGRAAVMIDFKSVSGGPGSVTWEGTCASVNVPRVSGRLWVDAETDDVLRLDEHVGFFEFPVPRAQARLGTPTSMVLERYDSTIRYREVAFTDPDETLMLPRTIETSTVWRNASVPRERRTQTFTDYRRFVTDGRIVVDDAVQ